MRTETAVRAPEITNDIVMDVLGRINYPGLTRDLVSFGMVRHVSVCDGRVKVQLALRTRDEATLARIRESIDGALTAIGAVSFQVEIVAPKTTPLPVRHETRDPWADRGRLASVRHVIAVGAGKGGVGKITVAVNLALALSREGLRTALLDADIYGPSLPILLGIEDGARRVRMSEDKCIVPLEAHGLPMISFGFFLGEGSPAIWRGPMVSKAVKQFARGVLWPELDVLIVDLPPGTGDIPLSLAQSVELSGAVIVTQPPRVAAAEARKAVTMFRSLEVPLLGIVENMTGPFGSGGGSSLGAELDVPFLGAIPFDAAIVAEGDAGIPTMIARPESDAGVAFQQVSRRVAGALGWTHVADHSHADRVLVRIWRRPSASITPSGVQEPMSIQSVELDVRVIAPRDKHPAIFRAFDALESGQSLVLMNDHDPRPLRYQLAAERPDTFDWAYEAEGPELWRVRISRR